MMGTRRHVNHAYAGWSLCHPDLPWDTKVSLGLSWHFLSSHSRESGPLGLTMDVPLVGPLLTTNTVCLELNGVSYRASVSGAQDLSLCLFLA